MKDEPGERILDQKKNKIEIKVFKLVSSGRF